MLALTGYKLAHYMAGRLANRADGRLADCHSVVPTTNEQLANRIDPTEFTDGQWVFIDQPFPNTRNANFIALKLSDTAKADEAYFFKQPLVVGSQVDTLYNEAQFYEKIGRHFSVLKSHLLEIVQYDYANKILILKYRRSSLMFSNHLARLPNPRDPKLGNQRLEATIELAKMLKLFKESLSLEKLVKDPTEVHGVDKICLDISDEKDICFKTYTPWILTLTDADLIRFNESPVDPVKEFARLLYGKDPDAKLTEKNKVSSHGKNESKERVSKQFVLLDKFKKLQERWETTHLINADAHLSNIIVDSANTFYFIDWEYTSWGDPRWDFAGILSGYFTLLRTENPVLSTTEVKEHVKALCQEYFLNDTKKQKNICVCIQYAGLWLLTEYYAWAVSDNPSDNSIYQDKFRIGKICVFAPESIIEYFNL